MIHIGIDPGKRGAIAFIYPDGGVYVMPLLETTLVNVLSAIAGLPARCCLERVHAMPKQGVASTFSFGEGYGFIKGVLECNGVSYQEIPPQQWKKEFGLNSEKRNSVEVCHKLFPDVSLRPTERSKIDSDGMAEALLMAEYARRKL